MLYLNTTHSELSRQLDLIKNFNKRNSGVIQVDKPNKDTLNAYFQTSINYSPPKHSKRLDDIKEELREKLENDESLTEIEQNILDFNMLPEELELFKQVNAAGITVFPKGVKTVRILSPDFLIKGLTPIVLGIPKSSDVIELVVGISKPRDAYYPPAFFQQVEEGVLKLAIGTYTHAREWINQMFSFTMHYNYRPKDVSHFKEYDLGSEAFFVEARNQLTTPNLKILFNPMDLNDARQTLDSQALAVIEKVNNGLKAIEGQLINDLTPIVAGQRMEMEKQLTLISES